MNRQRKILLTITAIGAAALLADRFILGPGESGPRTASAAGPVEPVGTAVGGADPNAILERARATLATTSGSERVAKRLVAVAGGLGIEASAAADAFEPGAAWGALVAPMASGESGATAKDPAERFAESYTLRFVMHGGAGSGVIVEGPFPDPDDSKGGMKKASRPIQIGKPVADTGFVLTEVGTDSAVFTRDERVARLTIKRRELNP